MENRTSCLPSHEKTVSEQQFQFIPSHVNENIPDPIQNYEMGEVSVPSLVFMTQGKRFNLSETQSLYLENGNKNTVRN